MSSPVNPVVDMSLPLDQSAPANVLGGGNFASPVDSGSAAGWLSGLDQLFTTIGTQVSSVWKAANTPTSLGVAGVPSPKPGLVGSGTPGQAPVGVGQPSSATGSNTLGLVGQGFNRVTQSPWIVAAAIVAFGFLFLGLSRPRK